MPSISTHKNTYLPYTWLKRRAIMSASIARMNTKNASEICWMRQARKFWMIFSEQK